MSAHKNVFLLHHREQKGATLIVALIILLVMTIIGISSMKSSTLQERMAGNARQKTIAKNAALTAMREAELWLQANVQSPEALSTFNGSSGLFSAVTRPSGGKAEIDISDFDVTDPADWAGEGVESSSMSTTLVSQQPKYIIEYIGRDLRGAAASPVKMLDVESKADADLSPYFFRITAIGWGKDANIYSVLESTFMTGYGDGAFVY